MASPAITLLLAVARFSPASMIFAMALINGGCSHEALAAVSLSDEQIRAAFQATSGGFSTDELLIDDTLRDEFLAKCGIDTRDPRHDAQQTEALKRLLRLRKTGKLNVPTTQRRSDSTEAVSETAEIAIRTVLDRHDVSIDDVFCNPRLRRELQDEALKLDRNVDARLVRKAVLRLRKVRKLRPELVLRVASWKRQVVTFSFDQFDEIEIPRQPGIYLFRNADGYLYIGEAANLSERLQQHRTGSHNQGLANLLGSQPAGAITVELHVFDTDSAGNQLRMRRAYESELIRSREPKFNLRP